MSRGANDEILSFNRPPVVEVVCGAQFHSLPLQTPHFGLFWDKVRTAYPTTLDAPPLPAVVEAPAGGVSMLRAISWSDLPELRRVFFVNEERGRLLQVQPTRFHYNWQRKSESDLYPRFPEVRSEFLDNWRKFSEFLREVDLPPPHVIQGELPTSTTFRSASSGTLPGSASCSPGWIPATVRSRPHPSSRSACTTSYLSAAVAFT